MLDPLQFETIDEPLQMGLEEGLFLLHRHRQHLETYDSYFSRLKEHLSLHILLTQRDRSAEQEERQEIEQQINHIAEQFTEVTRLQEQINKNLLEITQLLNHLSVIL